MRVRVRVRARARVRGRDRVRVERVSSRARPPGVSSSEVGAICGIP